MTKFLVRKDIPSNMGFDKHQKICKGELCYLRFMDGVRTIYYQNAALCDFDSVMAHDYFVEVDL